MVRLDACAGLELKAAMASGRPEDRTLDLSPCDPRAFDIHFEYPDTDIPVWRRPWVRARLVNDYPLEFRVFVQDDKVLGVASYYPQRPLPDTAEIRGLADTCVRRADTLIQSMKQRKRQPWMPSYARHFNETGIHATLDFIVTEANDVVFLEAGPPFGAGAHPCAFLGQEIEGLALRLADGVVLR